MAALQADVDRRDLLSRAVHTLVDNQLRPGAEASRSDAERAAAQTRLIQAQQSVTLAQITLARVLGVTSWPVAIDATTLVDRLPADARAAAPATHPLTRSARPPSTSRARKKTAVADGLAACLLSVECVRARQRRESERPARRRLSRAWSRPRQLGGRRAGRLSQRLRLHEPARAEGRRGGISTRETALYDEALLTVTSQQQAAAAMVQAARAVAANTPVQLAAARQSEAQARARYQAGLASIVEVADAQSLLAQAEVQDQLARIDVWRALLAQSAAQGTLSPFLSLLNPSAGVR